MLSSSWIVHTGLPYKCKDARWQLTGSMSLALCISSYTLVCSLQTLNLEESPSDDFLDALLGESDSSTTASPLWSPCTTDSGINEEPVAEPSESVPLPSCTAFQGFGPKTFCPPSPPEYQPPPNETAPYVSIDLGKTYLGIILN